MELAAKKEIKLFLNVDPDFSEIIFADPQRFRRTLINLICKAAKYTAKGALKISVDNNDCLREESLPITVNLNPNNNIGCSMSHLSSSSHSSAALAEEPSFIPVSANTISDYPGVGSASALSSGRGNPEPPPVSPRLVVDISNAELNPDALRTEAPDARTTVSGPRKKAPAWTDLEFPPCSIMVVDHFGDTHLCVKHALDKYNFAWVHVYDVRQMLESVQKYHPDLILLDMTLRGTDAIESLRQLRGWERLIHQNAAKRGRAPRRGSAPDEELQTIPVLAVTPKIQPDQERQLILSGCNDVAIKPLSAKDLIQKIARHIPSWDSKAYRSPELQEIKQTMEASARRQWEEKKRLWTLQCQMYSQAIVFDDIQDMAEEIQQFSIQTKTSLLERWAKKLLLAAKFYDISEIKKLLLEFEALPV